MVQPAAIKSGSLLGIHAAGVGVCVAISLLWYVTTVGPLLRQRALAAEQQQRIQTQQQKAEEMRSALASVQRQLKTVQQELAAGAIQLDSAAQINRRMAVLTEFFAECALRIDDVQTGRTYRGLQCDLVPITIVGRGDYTQCVRFLHRLRSVFPDMSVMRIELGGPGDPGLRTLPGSVAAAQQFRFELFWYTAPHGRR